MEKIRIVAVYCKKGGGGIDWEGHDWEGIDWEGHEKLLEVTVLFSMLMEVCTTGICKYQKTGMLNISAFHCM